MSPMAEPSTREVIERFLGETDVASLCQLGVREAEIESVPKPSDEDIVALVQLGLVVSHCCGEPAEDLLIGQ